MLEAPGKRLGLGFRLADLLVHISRALPFELIALGVGLTESRSRVLAGDILQRADLRLGAGDRVKLALDLAGRE